ncbi:MAG: hypothetical protein FWG68_04810 [Defluviitaleaceae bacterium]|nr:hypothetical protein [Defluviitaleaceae bacterium]
MNINLSQLNFTNMTALKGNALARRFSGMAANNASFTGTSTETSSRGVHLSISREARASFRETLLTEHEERLERFNNPANRLYNDDAPTIARHMRDSENSIRDILDHFRSLGKNPSVMLIVQGKPLDFATLERENGVASANFSRLHEAFFSNFESESIWQTGDVVRYDVWEMPSMSRLTEKYEQLIEEMKSRFEGEELDYLLGRLSADFDRIVADFAEQTRHSIANTATNPLLPEFFDDFYNDILFMFGAERGLSMDRFVSSAAILAENFSRFFLELAGVSKNFAEMRAGMSADERSQLNYVDFVRDNMNVPSGGLSEWVTGQTTVIKFNPIVVN